MHGCVALALKAPWLSQPRQACGVELDTAFAGVRCSSSLSSVAASGRKGSTAESQAGMKGRRLRREEGGEQGDSGMEPVRQQKDCASQGYRGSAKLVAAQSHSSRLKCHSHVLEASPWKRPSYREPQDYH